MSYANKFMHGDSADKTSLINQILADKRWEDGGGLLWIYADMNSFFASCEQQDNKAYRYRPLIVVPTMTNYTGAIAASREAKLYGIKTGTSVIEAKQKYPDVIIVEARPNRYVELHHQIIAAVDKVIPIDSICSVDEFACLLMGPQRFEENARQIGMNLQRIILSEVGEYLTASVGIAPSKLLAKTAADIIKPLGLTVLRADELPGRLLDLEIEDFAGIGKAMGMRLRFAGIQNVKQLWDLSPRRMRTLWGGIMGENFWYALHGKDPPELVTTRTSISHSHILAPELRPPEAAHGVARRLVAKCGSRLRRMEYKTPRLMLSVRTDDKQNAGAEAHFPATSDSFKLMRTTDELWQKSISRLRGKRIRIKKVSVVCMALIKENSEEDLFGWSINQLDDEVQIGLLKSLDKLNQRYGKDTITIGPKTKIHNFVGAKIAFNRVPEKNEFRE